MIVQAARSSGGLSARRTKSHLGNVSLVSPFAYDDKLHSGHPETVAAGSFAESERDIQQLLQAREQVLRIVRGHRLWIELDDASRRLEECVKSMFERIGRRECDHPDPTALQLLERGDFFVDKHFGI